MYLLLEAFNPFTFKVIFDIYVPIGIFLLGLILGFSFFSLVFTAYIRPFSICCKDGLFLLNSLNFCLSVKLLISSFIWPEMLAGEEREETHVY